MCNPRLYSDELLRAIGHIVKAKYMNVVSIKTGLGQESQ